MYHSYSFRHGNQEADILLLGEKRKRKSPATRAAEEAADRLEPPVLPQCWRGDDGDGPSGSEEE